MLCVSALCELICRNENANETKTPDPPANHHYFLFRLLENWKSADCFFLYGHGAPQGWPHVKIFFPLCCMCLSDLSFISFISYRQRFHRKRAAGRSAQKSRDRRKKWLWYFYYTDYKWKKGRRGRGSGETSPAHCRHGVCTLFPVRRGRS